MSGIKLLVDSAHGVYVPAVFVEQFDLEKWDVAHLKDDIEECSDPENDWYWDSWQTIMENAEFIDENGNTWRLYQDGDLWAYCPELMDKDEWRNFFPDDPWPCPQDWVEYKVCQDCLIYLANGDLTGIDDNAEAAHIEKSVNALANQHGGELVADGDDMGFSHHACECCGGLAGNRYRVFGKEVAK